MSAKLPRGRSKPVYCAIRYGQVQDGYVYVLSTVCVCVWSSVFVFVLVCMTVCPFPCSNHLEEKDFVFIVSSMSCHFICSVALPHGAMGWSAVCASGISWS